MTDVKPICPECGKKLVQLGRVNMSCPDHGNKILELVFLQDTLNEMERMRWGCEQV